ncbi:MAG: ABC transporter ATP-binding protein, partial [Phycisphaerae bacterium]|nr:ABC transporter ATP-binding protein [Phycisphaerae bacterium]
MDDPTLGLDTAIRRQFLEGMIQLIQRRGRSILFSSHILSDVERVADRIAVIDKGVLRADCKLDEFRAA